MVFFFICYDKGYIDYSKIMNILKGNLQENHIFNLSIKGYREQHISSFDQRFYDKDRNEGDLEALKTDFISNSETPNREFLYFVKEYEINYLRSIYKKAGTYQSFQVLKVEIINDVWQEEIFLEDSNKESIENNLVQDRVLDIQKSCDVAIKYLESLERLKTFSGENRELNEKIFEVNSRLLKLNSKAVDFLDNFQVFVNEMVKK